AILTTTPAGLIDQANCAAADVLRVPADRLIGRPLAAFVPGWPSRMAFFTVLRRLRHGASGTYTFVGKLRVRSGRSFLARLTASAVRGPDGELTGLQWLVREGSDAASTPGSVEHGPRRAPESAPSDAPAGNVERRQRLLAQPEGAAAYYRALFDGALDA